MPRSLLDQFTLKQLIQRVRHHLVDSDDRSQLSVAKEFIRLLCLHTRSFAGKIFPVKFPVDNEQRFFFSVELFHRCFALF
jgi:hypothetical protein